MWKAWHIPSIRTQECKSEDGRKDGQSLGLVLLETNWKASGKLLETADRDLTQTGKVKCRQFAGRSPKLGDSTQPQRTAWHKSGYAKGKCLGRPEERAISVFRLWLSFPPVTNTKRKRGSIKSFSLSVSSLSFVSYAEVYCHCVQSQGMLAPSCLCSRRVHPKDALPHWHPSTLPYNDAPDHAVRKATFTYPAVMTWVLFASQHAITTTIFCLSLADA